VALTPDPVPDVAINDPVRLLIHKTVVLGLQASNIVGYRLNQVLAVLHIDELADGLATCPLSPAVTLDALLWFNCHARQLFIGFLPHPPWASRQGNELPLLPIGHAGGDEVLALPPSSMSVVPPLLATVSGGDPATSSCNSLSGTGLLLTQRVTPLSRDRRLLPTQSIPCRFARRSSPYHQLLLRNTRPTRPPDLAESRKSDERQKALTGPTTADGFESNQLAATKRYADTHTQSRNRCDLNWKRKALSVLRRSGGRYVTNHRVVKSRFHHGFDSHADRCLHGGMRWREPPQQATPTSGGNVQSTGQPAPAQKPTDLPSIPATGDPTANPEADLDPSPMATPDPEFSSEAQAYLAECGTGNEIGRAHV